jgi:hypothetical protein
LGEKGDAALRDSPHPTESEFVGEEENYPEPDEAGLECEPQAFAQIN